MTDKIIKKTEDIKSRLLEKDIYTIDNINLYLIKNNRAEYKCIYDAKKDSLSSRSEKYRVANGDKKSSYNEKWKFNYN